MAGLFETGVPTLVDEDEFVYDENAQESIFDGLTVGDIKEAIDEWKSKQRLLPQGPAVA